MSTPPSSGRLPEIDPLPHRRAASPSPVVRLVCLLFVCLAATAPAAARTPEEVACTRAALAELLSRLTVTDAAGQLPTVPQTLFLSRRGEGSFEGLVVGASGWRALSSPVGEPAEPGPEHHLAFQVHPGSRDLLANPERPPLPQVTLVREAQGTSLVAPGSPFEVHLHLDPTLRDDAGDENRVARPSPSPSPAAIRIDNLEVAFDPRDGGAQSDGGAGLRRGTPADTGPGRGVPADLGTGCGDVPEARERRVLAVLQRTLRPRLVDEIAGTVYDARVALYVGREPDEVRALIRLVEPFSRSLLPGELELAVSAAAGGDGRLLGSGGMRLVRRTGALTEVRGAIELVQPGVPGLERAGETVAALTVDPVVLAAAELFDWHEVLEPTAWNRQPSAGAVADTCTELAAAGGVTTAAIAEALATAGDGDEGTALLAARLAWALVAPAELVERVRADRRGIARALQRSGLGGIGGIGSGGETLPRFSPETPGDRLIVRGRLRELATGRSPRWETLLGCLGARPRYQPERGRAVLEIAPVFDLALLAEQLETVAAVTEVLPETLRPARPSDQLCARPGTRGEVGVFEYRLSSGADEYVHLVTRPPGGRESRGARVTVEDMWNRKLPTPAPDWMEGGWICDAWGD